MRYTVLSLCSAPASAVIAQRTAPAAPRLNPDSPTAAVMMKFAHEGPVIASPERHIDRAL